MSSPTDATGEPGSPPQAEGFPDLEGLVRQLVARVAELEARLDRMGEEVITKRLAADRADLRRSVTVGGYIGPHVAITSDRQEGFVGMTAWREGDIEAFTLFGGPAHSQLVLGEETVALIEDTRATPASSN